MGIYKTQTIYKSGLSLEDVENYIQEFVDITDKFTFDDNYFVNRNNIKIFYNKALNIVVANVIFQSKNFSTSQTTWKYIATADLASELGINIICELICFNSDGGTDRVTVSIDTNGIKYKRPSTSSQLWYASPGGSVLIVAEKINN